MTKKDNITILCTKEKEIVELCVHMNNVMRKVDDIHKHLVGNGRPGLLERVSNMEVGAKIGYVIIGVVISVVTLFLTFLK